MSKHGPPAGLRWTGDIDDYASIIKVRFYVIIEHVALLKHNRVLKSKVTRVEKQTAVWQNGTNKNTELSSIYLSTAQELAAECGSLLRSTGQHYKVSEEIISSSGFVAKKTETGN